MVWLITAKRAALWFSVSSQRRPCMSGIRRMGKYPGLTKLTRTLWLSFGGLPTISMVVFQPFEGGVA